MNVQKKTVVACTLAQIQWEATCARVETVTFYTIMVMTAKKVYIIPFSFGAAWYTLFCYILLIFLH